jgi:hypothetical protein
MYFSLVPNIEYDEKPISYPFSESDYVVAKNFFRRYQVNQDVFSYAVFFNKYSIQDGERPYTIAKRAYGDPFYDWVVLITNNIINPLHDWPLTNYELQKTVESEYDDPYGTIHHYETVEVPAGYTITTDFGETEPVIALQGGLVVDQTFYNSTFKYWNGSTYTTKSGNVVSKPVTVMDYYTTENEKKREIYLLKARYFQSFVDEFRNKNFYKSSGDYISQQLKRVGV